MDNTDSRVQTPAHGPNADSTARLVNLAQRVARLNPDYPQIGAGMLASLVDDARTALASPEAHTPDIRIEFTGWQCGHHWLRPEPIRGLTSNEQAESILKAMGSCISQPGSARAWVIDGTRFTEWYLTDDHASANHSAELPLIVPCGPDAEFSLDEFEDDALCDLLGHYGPFVTDWTPAVPLWGGEIALTRLTASELASLKLPADAPPYRVPSEPDVLAQARLRGAQYRAEHASYLAELAADANQADVGGAHV